MKKTTLLAVGLFVGLALAIAGLGHAFDASPLAMKAGLVGDFGLAMSVVTKYGTGARNPATLYAQAAIFAAAEIRMVTSQLLFANGDSIASTWEIAEVPADAIIDPDSVYDYEAIAGVNDFDIGVRYPTAAGIPGAVLDADCYVDGDDISSAGAQTLKGHATLTTANGHKRVWEIAGLTSNPGGNLTIYGTANAASTAANKVVNVRLRVLKNV